ncbi:MAG: hypothetical protein NTW38_06020 [Candidatus Aminicenantes bacterium]|nr:hypothetical protein [Candidatus Aminicenantes bacterium]
MFHKAGFLKLVGLSLVALLVMMSAVACGKKAAAPAATEGEIAQTADAGLAIVIGLNTVAGTVKNAKGNYFYMDEVPGFDVAVTGPVEGGDATALIGKPVRIKGLFNKDVPNLLVAQSIEIKEGEQQYKSVYASTDASAPQDFFNQKTREEYASLALTKIDKSEDWEGKGKGKVFGILIPAAAGQNALISVLGADDKEIGKVIVDSETNCAAYNSEKLRLFEKRWFYLSIKDSVDKKLRAKNKEMFRADVVFIGLY